MNKFLLLFGSTLLLSAVGSAAIVQCPTTTFDQYLGSVNTAGGCFQGATLFQAFTFTSPPPVGGAVAVAPINVSVTPTNITNPGNPGFIFTLPLSAGVNQANDVTLGYNATGSFIGANLFQTGGFAGTGNATTKDTFCLGGFLIACKSSASLQTQQNAVLVKTTDSTTFAASFVDVSKDILVTSNGAGTASISVAANTFNSPNAIPEPVSLLLMGSGLLALGVIGRRSRKA